MLLRLCRFIIVAAFVSIIFGFYPTTKIDSTNEENFTSATGTEEGTLNVDKGNSISDDLINDDIDEATKARVHENYGKLLLFFIRNDGQMDEKVKFYERGSGHSTYFTSEGVYLELISRKETKAVEEKNQNTPKSVKQPNDEIQNIKSEIIKLTPIGANKNPKIIAKGVQRGKVNYFIGNDPEKWKTNIPTYEAVVYKDIYKGIDMKFYGNNRRMEYDIIVKPGADLSQVQLSYEGIEGLSITGNGKT